MDLMRFETPKRESGWQYKKNEKGALVRDKKITIIKGEPAPVTLGALVKRRAYEKGIKLEFGSKK